MEEFRSHSYRNRRNAPPKTHPVRRWQYHLPSYSSVFGSWEHPQTQRFSPLPPLLSHITWPTVCCRKWVKGRSAAPLGYRDERITGIVCNTPPVRRQRGCVEATGKQTLVRIVWWNLSNMSHPRFFFFLPHTADLNALSGVHKSSAPNTPMLLNFTLLICSVIINNTPALSRSHSLIHDKCASLQRNKLAAISGLRVCGVISSVPPTWSVRNGVTSVAAPVATEDNLSRVVCRNMATI